MDNRIELLFGRGQLPVDLPPGAKPTIIRKGHLPKISDGPAAIRAALDTAVGAPSLAALARGRRSACILICDITRPVPNRLFLRPMIETMVAGGIPPNRITILVATGLHRPNEGEELAELIGDPWVLAEVRVENHFARDDAGHIDLGVTETRGTPIKIDRRFVEADLRIATGLVEPHFMAGWSGGRKVVAPGVAHHETIRTFHSARFMEDPLAVQCNLVGNPLHEEQLQIVQRLGEVYALNTVLDEDRDLGLRHLRRGHREPPCCRRFRHGGNTDPGIETLSHHCDISRRLSARQDLLPDGEGDGDAPRYSSARWHADHRVIMLGGFRLGRVPGGAAATRGARPGPLSRDPHR